MSIPLGSDHLLNNSEKSRKDWRRDCRQLMTKISAEQKARDTDSIAARLQPFIVQAGVKTIAVYWPIHDEPNLLPLWASLREKGFQLALPRVLAKGEALEFSVWRVDSVLLLNQWGIAELDSPAIALQDIGLIIMPCVGYWASGYRLGYGGGFYDRTLAQWRNLPPSDENKRIALGVAYTECVLPESLALLGTDQRCEVIITPDHMIYSETVGVSKARA
jgi:5,10-methenyltetrahydrofolate synthetase